MSTKFYSGISLRQYVDTLFAERDRQYQQRFDASEKAVEKAEIAQREYNAKSNEFRQSLDDSNKNNVARKEYEDKMAALQGKLDEGRGNFEKAVEGLRRDTEDKFRGFQDRLDLVKNNIEKDVAILRETNSKDEGRGSGRKDFWGWVVGAAGIAAAVFTAWR